MRDCTSSNYLQNIDKIGKSEIERIDYIKIKLLNHFRDMYLMLCNSYH